jgi:trigger factor
MVRFSQLALALCLAVSSDAFSGLSHTFKASKCVETTAFLLPQTLCASKAPSTRLFLSSAAESAPKSTMIRKDDSSVEISILAPGPATKAAYDKVTYELSKTISVPGFRKGAKIPAAVLENAMSAKGGRNAIRVQAIQTLLSQLLEPAFKEEHNLEPIGQPTLVVPAETLAEKFTPGEPIELTVRCDVWPDIKWRKVEGKDKPYMKLAHSYKRKPFNQKKLDMAIRDLKERYAELTLAPLEKELEMGDACVVNMVGYMAAADGISKGEPLPNAASGENVDIILGSGRYMDGLVEGLVGAKVGDTRTVSVRFPEVRYELIHTSCK